MSKYVNDQVSKTSKMTFLSKLNIKTFLIFYVFFIINLTYAYNEENSTEAHIKPNKQDFVKCQHGELSTQKTWYKSSPLFLEYDPHTKIACIEILEGKTKTLSGGLLDSKIGIRCLSSLCEINVYTRLSKKCDSYLKSEEFLWTENNSLTVNFSSDFIISCMQIIGSYKTLSGGVGFSSASLQCLSTKCKAQIFKEPFQKCDYGTPIVVKTLKNGEDFKFESSNIKILCKEIQGRYDVIAELDEDVIELRCYSLNCKLTLFANDSYEKFCENSGYNFTDTWTVMKPYNLNLDLDNQVTCFHVEGSYELLSGGIDQNNLTLKCLSEVKPCQVIIYLKNIHASTTTKKIPTDTLARQVRVRHDFKEIYMPTHFEGVNHLISTQPSNKYIFNYAHGQENCDAYHMETNSTWNSTQPLYVVTAKKIMCLRGTGPFMILSGGKGYNSVVASCSSHCYLEIYTIVAMDSGNVANCSSNTLFMIKEWTTKQPLVINMRQSIACFEVEGEYTVISGGMKEPSLVAECLSEGGCKVKIYVHPVFKDQWRSCQGYRLHMKKDWSYYAPVVVNLPSNMKIDCFKVVGNYSVVAGGEKSSTLILECSVKNCTVEIYVGKKPSNFMIVSQVDHCEGKLIESKCWDKTKTLQRRLSQNDRAILCTNITGDYQIISGGIGESFIEIECLEFAKDCCISLYSTSVFSMAALNNIPNEDVNDETPNNCSYGRLEMTHKWKYGTIEHIALESNGKIVCLSGIGSYKVKNGDIGSSSIELECLSMDGCQVEVFSVKSSAQKLIAFLNIWAVWILIKNLFKMYF